MEKKVMLILPIFLAFLFVAVVSLCTADVSNFAFEKETIYNVVPAENITIPASYYLTIRNTGEVDDSFRIYTWLNLKLEPTEFFEIGAGDETTITVTMLPSEKVKERCGFGLCGIKYYIEGNLSDAIEDHLYIKVIPIDEIIKIVIPETIAREDISFAVNITNEENINFEKISVSADCNFCKTTKNTSLGPKSSEILVFDLDKTEIEKAEAGDYIIKFTVTVNDEYSYDIEKSIILEEFASITTTESLEGAFLGCTKSITKKNDGNLAKLVTIEITKGNFEKMFTRYSTEAAYETAENGAVKIGWQHELEPGESFTIKITTNYSWLVLILVIIIGGVTAFYLIKRPRFIIKKKAYKIKAKGGEFAVKLLIVVKNVGLEAHDVKCIDYIPKIAKLHERFGAIKPDVIEKNKLQWNFGTVAPDEEKIVSYIIYSDVKPVGAITLPKAILSFVDATGKKHHLFSNKAFTSGAD